MKVGVKTLVLAAILFLGYKTVKKDDLKSWMKLVGAKLI
jgi:hypothetical protein